MGMADHMKPEFCSVGRPCPVFSKKTYRWGQSQKSSTSCRTGYKIPAGNFRFQGIVLIIHFAGFKIV
jgi:hypothetical protein